MSLPTVDWALPYQSYFKAGPLQTSTINVLEAFSQESLFQIRLGSCQVDKKKNQHRGCLTGAGESGLSLAQSVQDPADFWITRQYTSSEERGI